MENASISCIQINIYIFFYISLNILSSYVYICALPFFKLHYSNIEQIKSHRCYYLLKEVCVSRAHPATKSNMLMFIEYFYYKEMQLSSLQANLLFALAFKVH